MYRNIYLILGDLGDSWYVARRQAAVFECGAICSLLHHAPFPEVTTATSLNETSSVVAPSVANAFQRSLFVDVLQVCTLESRTATRKGFMDGVPKALRSSLSLQFEANLALRTINHNPDVSQLFALFWKQQERKLSEWNVITE